MILEVMSRYEIEQDNVLKFKVALETVQHLTLQAAQSIIIWLQIIIK